LKTATMILTLTLTQPWATFVAIHAKRIEMRSWANRYRGPRAIHAAKGFPPDARALCTQEQFKTARGAAGYHVWTELRCGAVIATCRQADIVPTARLLHGPGDEDLRLRTRPLRVAAHRQGEAG